MATAEDIVNNNNNNNTSKLNEKLLQLILLIHKNHCSKKQSISGSNYSDCIAKGSGLVAGVVNTRCKINVIVPFEDALRLEVIICSAHGDHHKEVINKIPSR